jgi:hypothetical protein
MPLGHEKIQVRYNDEVHAGDVDGTTIITRIGFNGLQPTRHLPTLNLNVHFV